MDSVNIFGQPLQSCSTKPVTGYYRDGCCNTGPDDTGSHVICCIMTVEFLNFTLSRGNDLITPKPIYQFPGLKEGDRWCLCALRWKEAYEVNCAPPVILESTNEAVLKYVPMEALLNKAYKEA